jgi:hypothetical protein
MPLNPAHVRSPFVPTIVIPNGLQPGTDGRDINAILSALQFLLGTACDKTSSEINPASHAV